MTANIWSSGFGPYAGRAYLRARHLLMRAPERDRCWGGLNEAYCASSGVGCACFITGGGFHFPVRASLFGA